MKKLSNAFILLSAGLFLNACGSNDTTKTDTTTSSDTSATTTPATDTSSSANRMTDTTSTTKMASTQPPDKDATNFVMKAAGGGMMEVELGKVAQEKAKNQRVKDFGGMMVTDHSAANDELKGLASSKNITIPSTLPPDEQKHLDMLKSKSGADFDKAYTNMMVEDHKKDIAEFKKASETCTDADIKNFAAKTLPTLQKHLDSIQAIHHSKM
jgi:putative membrane protein